ncbi:hypothetical protein EI94DRAFT_979562 [Lactarius quietus]|nr:hypothetical protein EI94DRAFT_979562 [Lactarius quietus]
MLPVLSPFSALKQENSSRFSSRPEVYRLSGNWCSAIRQGRREGIVYFRRNLGPSSDDSDEPCPAFLRAGAGRKAWVVQTTFPAEKRWKNWEKRCKAAVYWMDVSPLAELIALGKILHVDINLLRDNYNKWGPSTRLCMDLTRLPYKDVKAHESDVVKAAYDLIKGDVEFDALDKESPIHRIFVQRPKSLSDRQESIVEFGTDHLRAIVARAYAEYSDSKQLDFTKIFTEALDPEHNG